VASPFFPLTLSDMPGDVELSCPQCRHSARFEAPFLLHAEQPEHATGRVVQFGKRFLEERYPHVVGWEDPDNAARSSHHHQLRSNILGVLMCPACGITRRHLLDWPADAYFTCTVKGELLWAWNREHLLQIRDFIQKEHRPGRGTRGWIGSIPTHFLLAKNRDAAIKAIDKALDPER
jgi:hypothetical protein